MLRLLWGLSIGTQYSHLAEIMTVRSRQLARNSVEGANRACDLIRGHVCGPFHPLLVLLALAKTSLAHRTTRRALQHLADTVPSHASQPGAAPGLVRGLCRGECLGAPLFA